MYIFTTGYPDWAAELAHLLTPEKGSLRASKIHIPVTHVYIDAPGNMYTYAYGIKSDICYYLVIFDDSITNAYLTNLEEPGI